MHNGSSTIQQQENAMGWVVYDEKSGHMQKYYKLASTAKRICTQHNTERDYDFYTYRPERKWAFCSYRDYEGVLMGLRGDALKMWQFCNTEIG
jgi:hypothetical protein